jgi:tight adherence protein C
MTMILVFAVFCLAGAAFLIGEIATAPARQRWNSVRRAATYGRMEVRSEAHGESFHDRFLAPLREWLAGLALKANPRLSVDSIAMKLHAAGVGRRISPTGFLALKGGAALGGIVVGTMVGQLGGIGTVFLGALCLGALGFFIPDYALTMKGRGRRERIRADLPDALDLLAVSVEAGLGFDGAVAKLSEHMVGPLAEEFGLTLSEMRIGESRQEALKRLSERVDAPELSAFVRAIIQADTLGTTLGRILRVQAADSRLRRQAAAEERAMKAPIKMLFPTVLFIFPAMFLVILGPAILNIQELF